MSNSIKEYKIPANDFIEVSLSTSAFLQSGDNIIVQSNIENSQDGYLLSNNNPFKVSKGTYRLINKRPIKATISISYTYNSEVIPDDPTTAIDATDVEFIDPEWLVLNTRRNPKIQVIPTPLNATAYETTFTSSNPNAIMFNSDGTFNIGSDTSGATITCTVKNLVTGTTFTKDKFYQPNTQLTLQVEEIKLIDNVVEVGKTKQIKYTLTPVIPQNLLVVNVRSNIPDSMSVVSIGDGSYVVKASDDAIGNETVRLSLEVIFRSCEVEEDTILRIAPVGGFVKATSIDARVNDTVLRGIVYMHAGSFVLYPLRCNGYTIAYTEYESNPDLNQYYTYFNKESGLYSLTYGAGIVKYGYGITITNWDGSILRTEVSNNAYSFGGTYFPLSYTMKRYAVLYPTYTITPVSAQDSANLKHLVTNVVWTPDNVGGAIPTITTNGRLGITGISAGVLTFDVQTKYSNVISYQRPVTMTIKIEENI